MAKINMTDLAQGYVAPTLSGYFLEDLKVTPELDQINVKTSRYTSYRKLKQVTVGTAGFRRLNQGVAANNKPEFKLVDAGTALIERRIEYDAALVDEMQDQENHLAEIRGRHVADAVVAANRKIAANFWYGRDLDADGFDGLENLCQLTEDAGGGDAGNHRSIYLIRPGDASNEIGVSLIFTILAQTGSIMGLRYPTWQNKQMTDSDSLEYDGEYNTLVTRPGLEVLNKYACIRIKEITAYGGSNPPSDDLVYDAIATHLGSTGISPRNEGWTAWMHPQVANDLRKARTNVNSVTRTATGLVASPPDTIGGLTIVETPNLTITEA